MITGAERDEIYVLVSRLDGQGDALAVPGFSDNIDDELLFGVAWLSDRYIQITYRTRITVPGGSLNDADIARRIVYDLNEGDYVELPINATIESLLPDDPEHVLISAAVVQRAGSSFAAGRGHGIAQSVNLYLYDLNRNDYDLQVRGTADTVNWVLGDDMRTPVLRQDYDADGSRWRIFAYEGRNRSLVYNEGFVLERFGRTGQRAISQMSFLVGQDHLDRGVWFSQLENRDFDRAFLFNPATGQVEAGNLAPSGFDLGGFITDWRTGKVIGAGWLAERRGRVWFDPQFEALQAQLQQIFPDSDVVINSWDRAGARFIVNVLGGLASTDYYLFDSATNELSFLATEYPEVPQERIHSVQVVDYTARDGLALWGYLTLPNDRGAQDLPLIIAPHGGPQSRDTYGFDPIFAQPFADMGYAVFQPHFRGSDGTGLGFVRRGHGEWGRAMQNDISDAVLALSEAGVADADRVCIWGWSYGGYAALAGYALTPELYRCAIAGAPVSDITTMMSWQADQQGGVGAVNYWTEYIGDWRTQRAQMQAISPLRQIENTDIPLLLIHGEEDNIVPVEQSEIMFEAVRAAGKPVEYVPIAGDGHNLLFRSTRLQTLQTATQFLMEHNPPDPR
ncbi:MAG: prolyl oligopeptidase family serine peptidase [Pseudomonadota bacterium]